MPEYLSLSHSQHQTRFVLSAADAFDAAFEDHGKIASVIDNERDQNRNKRAARIHSEIKVEPLVHLVPKVYAVIQNARGKVHDENLKHQRDAPNDPNKHFEQILQRFEFAHQTKGDDHPERDSHHQGKHKNQACKGKASEEALRHIKKRHK